MTMSSSYVLKMGTSREKSEPFDIRKFEIPKDKLVIYEEIVGVGSFGKVRRGRLIDPPTEVVWKTLKKEDINAVDVETLEKEFKNQSCLDHKNIVKTYGITRYQTNDNLEAFGIVMEYVDGLGLHQVIERHQENPYSNEQAISWALQAAEALKHMHSLPDARLIHRDIKPENMLLNADRTVLKICDFGLARELTSYAWSIHGSPLYMAPEMFDGAEYNETCDVYSWALSFWECLSREKPFKECKKRRILTIVKTNTAYRLPEIPNVSPAIQDLIRNCSTFNREKRPAMAEVVNRLNALSN